MNLLKNLFSKKEEPIKSNEDFWRWFQINEKQFFTIVKEQKHIVNSFFNKLSPKLNDLKEGYYFLTGMNNDDIAELVITAEGIIKNIVFVEELVDSAPKLDNWLFTALKPALDVKDVGIEMENYKFSSENLFFYPEDFDNYPDEIDISIIHEDFNEQDKSIITNGCYIFLDNFLGELNFATTIDNLTVIGKKDAEKELIPIKKLKDYIVWRQKEFVEKYDGIRQNTETDEYTILKATLKNGAPLFATINQQLLAWDSKPSHPWIATVEIKYDGQHNNGVPDEETYLLLSQIEDDILIELKDFEGYLYVGRQTAESVREIYFACADFRKPSKVLHKMQSKFLNKIDISYDIYKDKYWQCFDRFKN